MRSHKSFLSAKGIIVSLLFAIVLLSACGNKNQMWGVSDLFDREVNIDLPKILERDTLKAITTYSSTSYFIYKGKPMGYEYELLERLANHLGVELEIVIAEDLDNLFDMLKNGKGDIVAHSLTVTKDRQKEVSFTLPHQMVRQVLVQRKPGRWWQMKNHEIEKELIRNPIFLVDKEVHVRKNSAYVERLENLEEELGGEINIQYIKGNMATEEIIKMVNDGEIPYTIADEHIAMINKTYYRHIDIQTPIGLKQQLSWAVRKSSPQLLDTINDWISHMRRQTDYYVIFNKYFKNRKAFRKRAESDFFSLSGNSISRYDDLVRQHAGTLGWDWRLLSSLIYQESRFNANRTSWAGAQGLMQLMPRTARSYGYRNLKHPESNLKAGKAHIQYLNDYWRDKIADSTERVKFVLGSYNAGHNHVQDARRLAKKYNANPDRWDGHVAKYLKLKSHKEYFNDPVVYYGYCRGIEPVKYVKEILSRFGKYKKLIEPDESKEQFAMAK